MPEEPEKGNKEPFPPGSDYCWAGTQLAEDLAGAVRGQGPQCAASEATSVNAASRAAHVKADQLVSEGQWTFFEWVRL